MRKARPDQTGSREREQLTSVDEDCAVLSTSMSHHRLLVTSITWAVVTAAAGQLAVDCTGRHVKDWPVGAS